MVCMAQLHSQILYPKPNYLNTVSVTKALAFALIFGYAPAPIAVSGFPFLLPSLLRFSEPPEIYAQLLLRFMKPSFYTVSTYRAVGCSQGRRSPGRGVCRGIDGWNACDPCLWHSGFSRVSLSFIPGNRVSHLTQSHAGPRWK